MEIILLERVEKLGQMGQVVKVKPGFARNYLLPQKKALRATKGNLAYFQSQKTALEGMNLERRKEAEYVAARIEGLKVTIIRQAGESGVLYGSVNARDISDAVETAGFVVGRRQVAIEQPIKALGLVAVRIVLHPEVSVGITVNVARSVEEAELQLKRGGMVTASDVAAERAADERQAEVQEENAA